jgi:hypothetical protein
MSPQLRYSLAYTTVGRSFAAPTTRGSGCSAILATLVVPGGDQSRAKHQGRGKNEHCDGASKLGICTGAGDVYE